jgi:hypothetical protein
MTAAATTAVFEIDDIAAGLTDKKLQNISLKAVIVYRACEDAAAYPSFQAVEQYCTEIAKGRFLCEIRRA